MRVAGHNLGLRLDSYPDAWWRVRVRRMRGDVGLGQEGLGRLFQYLNVLHPSDARWVVSQSLLMTLTAITVGLVPDYLVPDLEVAQEGAALWTRDLRYMRKYLRGTVKVRRALAGNPNIPYWMLQRLARDPEVAGHVEYQLKQRKVLEPGRRYRLVRCG